jgi:hypothetical protein
MAKYYSDLHCHTTLFAYNRQYKDTWYEDHFPVYPIQGNFAQLARGNTRVVMLSLYPIEQGFLTVHPLDIGTGNISDFLARLIVDIPKERSDEIQNFNHEYYDDLIKELTFLQDSAMPVTHKVPINLLMKRSYMYRIVRNFNDLKTLLDLDSNMNPGSPAKDTIAVVLTIEGAHSLGVGQKNTLTKDPAQLKVKLEQNIAKLKNLGPVGHEGDWCPFFITLNHHFWNQLGGHAVSLWQTIRKVMDQNLGINENITSLGEFVADQLLDNSGGKRRILIDSSHMCINVRKWYFSYLASRGDNVPVFYSHIGVNGIDTMDHAQMQGTPDIIHDVADELYKNSTAFNPWDGLVSDEEIMIVHHSKGLIGLNLDQRIMMGKETLDNCQKKVFLKSAKEKRRIWIQPFINEILHIAKHIYATTGSDNFIWDIISLGSDFNGMITPIKPFNTADKLPALQETLFEELKKLTTSEPVLLGKTDSEVQEIVDKILWKNNLLFLERNFC